RTKLVAQAQCSPQAGVYFLEFPLPQRIMSNELLEEAMLVVELGYACRKRWLGPVKKNVLPLRYHNFCAVVPHLVCMEEGLHHNSFSVQPCLIVTLERKHRHP